MPSECLDVVRAFGYSALPRAAIPSLTASLSLNGTLRTLKLGMNCLDVGAARLLARAIERHAALTCLTLEHNQVNACSRDCMQPLPASRSSIIRRCALTATLFACSHDCMQPLTATLFAPS